jgi:hypothetical protein
LPQARFFTSVARRIPLTLLALVSTALALAGCGGSSSKSTPATTTSSPAPTTQTGTLKLPSGHSDLQSIIEDQGPLMQNPPATLALFKSLGIQETKIYIAWNAIAPRPLAKHAPANFDASNPGAYAASAWASYDLAIRYAQDAGVKVMLTLGSPAPEWADAPGEPAGGAPGIWKPSAAEFAEFAHAVGERYSGHYTPPGASGPLPKVDFWSIWNEPNYGPDLAPQAIDHTKVEVSPMLYRQLVDAAWTGLTASGHAGNTILIGETAPAGQTVGNHPGNFDGMVPLRFIRALYCVNSALQPLRGTAATERGCPATAAASREFPAQNPALFKAGGYAAHPYPQGAAPDVRTPDEPDFADLASLPELEQTLDKSQAGYGSYPKLPIYSTEFGYKTDPPLAGSPSPALAAEYLNWSEYISWLNPRVRSYDQYLIADPPQTGASSFDTGLEFANGTPKPSYAAFRMPLFLPVTQSAAGKALEVWGDVRPAYYAAGRQHAQIQFAAGSSSAFKTLKTVTLTDPSGYLDTGVVFPSSGRVRLAWKPASGPELFSRVVDVTVK